MLKLKPDAQTVTDSNQNKIQFSNDFEFDFTGKSVNLMLFSCLKFVRLILATVFLFYGKIREIDSCKIHEVVFTEENRDIKF